MWWRSEALQLLESGMWALGSERRLLLSQSNATIVHDQLGHSRRGRRALPVSPSLETFVAFQLSRSFPTLVQASLGNSMQSLSKLPSLQSPSRADTHCWHVSAISTANTTTHSPGKAFVV